MNLPQAYTDHHGTICVMGSAIINEVASKDLWDKWVKNCGLIQRGGNGRPSLIAFDKLPEKYRMAIEDRFGSPYEKAPSGLRDRLVPDPEAAAYYSSLDIAPEKQAAYAASAMVMNALASALATETKARAAHGKKIGDFWTRAAKAVIECRYDIGHNITTKNPRALRRKFETYKDESYPSLVHGGHGKQNALKVTYTLENLLMSLYTRPNNPFSKDVHTDYLLFMQGEIEVYDSKSGEILEPKNYTNSDGTPLIISESTVWNWLRAPKNQPIVDKHRLGRKDFNDTHRPHHHRHLPNYSFSKITLDDRDLPRKMKDGNRVKAYYCYDVLSGAVIGRAYSRSKDHELLLDCIKDMFRLMFRNNWGMPLEVEVEFHLVKEYQVELEKLYPFVRWCYSSQEKRAEHYNNVKKYGTEHRSQVGIGRFYHKSAAKRVSEDKINNEFVGKRYKYEELVADDLAVCDEYNAEPHHKPKRFPRMTRWDVLEEKMNPNLGKLDVPAMVKMAGYATDTSINRNSKFECNNAVYQLPRPFDKHLVRLSPNNYSVTAYWMPDDEGKVKEVHLYQGTKFIATCEKYSIYNEARGEWTEKDEAAYKEQKAQGREFDDYVNHGKNQLMKTVVERKTKRDRPQIEEAVVVTIPTSKEVYADIDDDLLNTF